MELDDSCHDFPDELQTGNLPLSSLLGLQYFGALCRDGCDEGADLRCFNPLAGLSSGTMRVGNQLHHHHHYGTIRQNILQLYIFEASLVESY